MTRKLYILPAYVLMGVCLFLAFLIPEDGASFWTLKLIGSKVLAVGAWMGAAACCRIGDREIKNQ